jgi:hypothetical protein
MSIPHTPGPWIARAHSASDQSLIVTTGALDSAGEIAHTVKTYTLDDIRELGPCYDPAKYAPEAWEGTLVDILDAQAVPVADRLWVVTGLLDDRTNRLFAVWCARRALARVDNPDVRSSTLA